jgi:hypothetical protein
MHLSSLLIVSFDNPNPSESAVDLIEVVVRVVVRVVVSEEEDTVSGE